MEFGIRNIGSFIETPGNSCGSKSEGTPMMIESKQLRFIKFCYKKCSSLAEVNTLLREQLEQANAANQALSEDLRKLTEDWSMAREELEMKETDWRREEERERQRQRERERERDREQRERQRARETERETER
uniref:rootletin-like n=1 Tax=Pristiophorus japonicus TaxID=55135 RepID=UPI00398EEC9C